MRVKLGNAPDASLSSLSTKCPNCGALGTFNAIRVGVAAADSIRIGLYRCPNPTCDSFVLILLRGNEIAATYPAGRLDFNPDGVPNEVVNCLREAITCHAEGCYRASAMMVRRSLEALCSLNDAQGSDLQARINSLGSKIILPAGFLDAMHNLRLLGNDAAHIESRHYEQVGKEEVELAIEVTKEILKAIYQYRGLADRLAKLRKT